MRQSVLEKHGSAFLHVSFCAVSGSGRSYFVQLLHLKNRTCLARCFLDRSFHLAECLQFRDYKAPDYCWVLRRPSLLLLHCTPLFLLLLLHPNASLRWSVPVVHLRYVWFTIKTYRPLESFWRCLLDQDELERILARGAWDMYKGRLPLGFQITYRSNSMWGYRAAANPIRCQEKLPKEKNSHVSRSTHLVQKHIWIQFVRVQEGELQAFFRPK